MRPLASWLSYAGAWQRVRHLATKMESTGLRVAFWVSAALVILPAWWMLVTVWYLIWMLLFPVAFLLMVPWRLWRRSQRQAKAAGG
ncbi:hypothetical protein HRbin12_01103 [bacterium HR12]|nr:hypothetical protein HRbin12_01103 [bacterium HR12]